MKKLIKFIKANKACFILNVIFICFAIYCFASVIDVICNNNRPDNIIHSWNLFKIFFN